jgi:hypothetical protein
MDDGHGLTADSMAKSVVRPVFDCFSTRGFRPLGGDGNHPLPQPPPPPGGGGVGTTATAPNIGPKDQVNALTVWWTFSIVELSECATPSSDQSTPAPPSSGVFRPPRAPW